MKRPKQVKPGYRVEFEWIDSASIRGWDTETDPGLAQVKSIGIVVGVNDSAIAITTSVMNGGGFHSAISVPWIAIVKFRQFEKTCLIV